MNARTAGFPHQCLVVRLALPQQALQLPDLLLQGVGPRSLGRRLRLDRLEVEGQVLQRRSGAAGGGGAAGAALHERLRAHKENAAE